MSLILRRQCVSMPRQCWEVSGKAIMPRLLKFLAIAGACTDSHWTERLRKSKEPVRRCRPDVRAPRSGPVSTARCRDDGCGSSRYIPY